MKLCRFNDDRLGWVQSGLVLDVTAALDVLPAVRYPLPQHDLLIAHLPAVCARVRELAPQAQALPVESVQLLSPVANPSKIIGAPINYRAHIEESVKDEGIAHGRKITSIQDWGLFLKASTSLIGFGQSIVLRSPERRSDYECELAVVIGRRCSQVTPQQALDYVAGYSIGLDMTLRGPEFQCWRKSIDTYSVLGPWLVTADEVADPGALNLQLQVDGQMRQQSNTRHLVLDVPGLIAWASSMYTLMPGDIIMTGTPAGVGPVQPGEVLQASIEGIGSAAVKVANHYG